MEVGSPKRKAYLRHGELLCLVRMPSLPACSVGWSDLFLFVVVVVDDDGIKRILRHLYSILDDRAKQLLTTTSSKFPILFHLTITTGALGRF